MPAPLRGIAAPIGGSLAVREGCKRRSAPPIAHPSADDDIGRRGINSRKGTAMWMIGWLILGLIAGFIASKIVNKSGEGVILDILLGIVGAVVGGFLFSIVGAAPVTGLNIYSMIVAV